MIPASVRIFVCTEPIDMRYGFDRLASTARSRLGQDPQHGGALFVFSNRGANRLKVLWFDRNGYCLLYKRLHRAVFELPLGTSGSQSVMIDAAALARLLAGIDRSHRARAHRSRASVVPIAAHGVRRNVAAHADSLAHSRS
jgi:transposase